MTVTPPAVRASTSVTVGSIALGVVICLLWILQLATVTSLGRSDAAGNAIGEAYAAIQIEALSRLRATR